MDNKQTEKSMPDKWGDYIKKNIYKEFRVELKPLINKIDCINGNFKMAEILSLARKNVIWTSKTIRECRETDVPRWAGMCLVVIFRMLVVARSGHSCCQSPFPCVPHTESAPCSSWWSCHWSQGEFHFPSEFQKQTCPVRGHPPSVCWGCHCCSFSDL